MRRLSFAALVAVAVAQPAASQLATVPPTPVGSYGPGYYAEVLYAWSFSGCGTGEAWDPDRLALGSGSMCLSGRVTYGQRPSGAYTFWTDVDYETSTLLPVGPGTSTVLTIYDNPWRLDAYAACERPASPSGCELLPSTGLPTATTIVDAHHFHDTWELPVTRFGIFPELSGSWDPRRVTLPSIAIWRDWRISRNSAYGGAVDALNPPTLIFATPEPATGALVAGGLLAVAGLARRRRATT